MSGIHSIYYYLLNNISRGLYPTLIARRRGCWIFQIFGLFINYMRDRDQPEEHEECSKLITRFDGGRRVQSRGLSKGKPQPLGRAERSVKYVGAHELHVCAPGKRPRWDLCLRAWAARSASSHRREAAPAKSGNAADSSAEAPAQARRHFSTLPRRILVFPGIDKRIDSGLRGNIRQGCRFGLGGPHSFNP